MALNAKSSPHVAVDGNIALDGFRVAAIIQSACSCILEMLDEYKRRLSSTAAIPVNVMDTGLDYLPRHNDI